MRILVSDKLAERGLKILNSEKSFKVDVKTDLSPKELKSIIKDYDALIVRSSTKVTKDIIDAAKKLKVIGRAGVGLDNVDLQAANRKGIIVMNTPAGNTISTAEHTLSLILSLSRNIASADASMKKGDWNRSKFMGIELYGKTLGLVGMGKIGSEVAKRALSFGMTVIAYDPFLSEEVARQSGVELVELKVLFSRSDYISVHTPLTDETRNIISAKSLKLMKKNVRIINCARGGIVDEKVLITAVKEGKIGGFALDVYVKEPPDNKEFINLDGCVLTPHLGASTAEAQVNVAVQIAEQVRDTLCGGGIRNAANYPCLEAEVCKVMNPYIILAEKLGSFAAQMVEGRIKEVNIAYSGEIVKYDLKALTLAIAKGILSLVLQDNVNFVNALTLAQERRIKINETKSNRVEGFTNLIEVAIKTDKGQLKVSGTLSENAQPRIVIIKDFYVEISPFGFMLVIDNIDRPGIIGAVGTILGKNDINIASMTFGRESAGGEAITVLNIDSPISDKIISQLKKNKNIKKVRLIKL
ncbi:MAG: phosphoglycerate dehydrogenase [Candidatus Omnitrophica bacterium]|nr:phosphoglycerate dehydrogenase [Candidatus Omnitrophota bacterium]